MATHPCYSRNSWYAGSHPEVSKYPKMQTSYCVFGGCRVSSGRRERQEDPKLSISIDQLRLLNCTGLCEEEDEKAGLGRASFSSADDSHRASPSTLAFLLPALTPTIRAGEGQGKRIHIPHKPRDDSHLISA